jgi:hypothetical protein
MSTICHPGLPFPLVSKPSICHTKCEGLNLRECCTSIVDVLYAKGKQEYFSKRKMDLEKRYCMQLSPSQ